MVISEKLARIAYRAYGESTGWKNFQGNKMPEFDDLPGPIQAAWRAASLAVAVHAPSLTGGEVGASEVQGPSSRPRGAEADCG